MKRARRSLDSTSPVRTSARTRLRRSAAGCTVLALVCALLGLVGSPVASAAPVGQGFTLNAADLRFILKQIQISEAHAANTNAQTGPCGALLGNGTNQIPNNGVGVTLPWGLRTVSGVCNNLEAGQSAYGTADRTFPRHVAKKLRGAESGDPDGPGPAPSGSTSYQQSRGIVIDSQPRVISNLIVDQTADNPAAVAAGGPGAEVDPRTGSIFIPNVAPDGGISAPYNSWFTLFGQFFDHGLDLVKKGGNGTVYMPLKKDDPRYVEGAQTNFMVLTRATHGGDHEASNSTSPFIDQSQTYSSHPSHQVFLREYRLEGGVPVGTGELITGPDHGMADWATLKKQAETVLGIRLRDTDVTSVPLLATDAYGRFTRGPNGFPQLVVPAGADGVLGNADDGLVEGNPSSPVTTEGATKSGHAFLDDIAHHAVPTGDIDPSDGPSQIVPLTPDSDPGTTDDKDRATYDDEMLEAHFLAGDGRVNENIGLIAVHHVFHSEHNRLTGDIEAILDSAAVTDAQRAQWRATGPSGWDYGERLFQAARFVTEMEYQHLAFEEFARKVQPMVNAFGEGGTGYRSDVDPAITAEFAHAVYRFGHSMLNESVDRTTKGGARRDMDLLDAFLNPPAFLDGAADPEAAAGDIVRGMTRQTGNGLDEFVTDALRDELLGLPLDLAALNLARGRETGVPTLNEARRSFFDSTADSGLEPYTSWADLNFSLKHPGSFANFIAAYGTHPSITGATTLADKRAAAEALLEDASSSDPEVSQDPYDFLNSTGAYANKANGVTTTGVDDIDLWVGGLAEKQTFGGGLLGPTFNHVFELQMESLQDADRFYYLSRTAGLNLLVQLEGNSFSELIQRNTDVEGLPADSFSTPDYVFDVAKLGTTGPIPDDPDTADWDESKLLLRQAEGTIRYAGAAHVVFNGSPKDDRMRSSEGDDTIRGNQGSDRMEGGDGADHLIGGEGDDIMTDLFGDDVLKGGPGNDAMSSGRGFGGDLNQGGLGKDFIVGGNDMTETFAGPGDDFVFAGDDMDTVFGDDGDDWIEGGKGPFNLLQGDNGAPFQDDPNDPGHDVMFSYGGEQDYDAEGGDDVMLLGPGIQRNEGMQGFDFTSHKNDPQPGSSDMAFTGLLPPAVDTNRDRFDLVESLSGWKFDDTLRGDDREAADMEGHELDAAGIARVAGLSGLLSGATSFTGGNILLGGEGADTIEGRGGDDRIDGDAWLNVQLRAPDLVNGGTKLVDTMASLRTDVFAGRINPGDIHIVRSIDPGAAGTDTAVFSGPRADYDLTPEPTGLVVDHVRGAATDGRDTLTNVERLQFTDQTVTVAAPAVATIGTTTSTGGIATVAFAAPIEGGAVDSFTLQVRQAGVVVRTVTDIAGTATSAQVAGLAPGTYTFAVSAVNQFGPGPYSAESNPVTLTAVAVAPSAPTALTATRGNASATLSWTPGADGGAPITGHVLEVRTGTTVVRTQQVGATSPVTVTGLTNGTAYTFRLRAVNAAGTSPLSAPSNAVTPATVPGQTRILAPRRGANGGALTAIANWNAPVSNGGSPITSYRVAALRMAANGTTAVGSPIVVTVAGTARTAQLTLPAGSYRFEVTAVNAVGAGPPSARSALVVPR